MKWYENLPKYTKDVEENNKKNIKKNTNTNITKPKQKLLWLDNEKSKSN